MVKEAGDGQQGTKVTLLWFSGSRGWRNLLDGPVLECLVY